MQHTTATTADGSSTLQLTQFGETYHSRNGAYTEAIHIYIKNGLEHLFAQLSKSAENTPASINIFDVGFGTGLNCILSYVWQQQLRLAGLPYPHIAYYGIEKYPITAAEIEQLNYHTIIAEHSNFLPDKISEILLMMHSCPWEKGIPVAPVSAPETPSLPTPDQCPAEQLLPGSDFILHKTCADIAAIKEEYYREARKTGGTDIRAVIFYDTFSPATQPELWDEAIFRTITAGCATGSVLVTYCCKGTVKQALRSAGFTLERLPGPPGKRHILRGTL